MFKHLKRIENFLKKKSLSKSNEEQTDNLDLQRSIPTCFHNDCFDCDIVMEIGDCNSCPFFLDCCQSLFYTLDY